MLRLALTDASQDATLVRVEAPHCVAGLLIMPGGHVVGCAPILRFMLGWQGGRAIRYCRRKGWRFAVIAKRRSHAEVKRRLRELGIT